MSFHSRIRFVPVGLACLWLFASPALAVKFGEEIERDVEEPAPWKERLTGVPAFPNGKHYLAVPLDPARGQLEMFIDEPALSIGEDGVVRYTLILRSPSGTENVFYEGIRCSTREWRSYAYGTSAGTWQTLGETAWQPLLSQGFQRYRLELYRYYLCDPATGPRTRDDMLRRMRYGVPADEVMGIDG